MTNVEADSTAEKEFDAWFAEVCKIAKAKLNPDDDLIWMELWFDGYTPEEAVRACNEED